MKTLIKIAIIAIVAHTNIALACEYNSDCGVGGKCVRQAFSSNGVCVDSSGMRDRNQEYNDRKNIPNKEGEARSCQSDLSCRTGQRCIKNDWETHGYCH